MLKPIFLAAAAAACLAGSPALAQSADPSGTWNGTFGELKLQAKERKDAQGKVVAHDVTGTYYEGKASLKGELKGGVLNGYWVEPGGGQQCATARDGSRSWGRLVFTFRGDHFDGRWQYCDAAPDQDWKGDRVS
jgi:opacity protein-like surface antigen